MVDGGRKGTVLVTGGTCRIGKAIADALRNAGWKVLTSSHREDSGADFIKTSTGFSTGGATFADVELMVRNVKPGVLVKAAGGISSLEDAEKFLDLGASRLGTSRVVKILKNEKSEGKY